MVVHMSPYSLIFLQVIHQMLNGNLHYLQFILHAFDLSLLLFYHAILLLHFCSEILKLNFVNLHLLLLLVQFNHLSLDLRYPHFHLLCLIREFIMRLL
jgi:hypothetical protein